MTEIEETLGRIKCLERSVRKIVPPEIDSIPENIAITEIEAIEAIIDHMEFSYRLCRTIREACKEKREVSSAELLSFIETINSSAEKWIRFLSLNHRLDEYRFSIIAMQTEMNAFIKGVLKKIIFVFPLLYEGKEPFH